MKIICAGCSTKYSIEDGKVAGKVFKVRCRACGLAVVVRGEANATGAISAADIADAVDATPASGAPVWHAVQDGRQIGPFDSGELLRRRAAGELDDGSYVWREGFADWQPLGAVDELRSGVVVASGPAAAPATSAPVSVAALAASAAPGAVDTGADGSRLHGARRESSLLFSLDGIAKAAAPKAAPARPGAAAGEGSGLIDIRSLARAYEPVARATDAARTRPGADVGSSADLPMFPGAAFMAPTVLIPQAPQRDRRLVVGLAAAAGLIAICATLLVVIALTRGGQPATADGARSVPGPRFAQNDLPVGPRGTSPDVVEPPPVRTPEAKQPDRTPEAKQPDRTAKQPDRTAKQPDRTTKQPDRTTKQPDRTAKQPTPPAAPEDSKCDQVTCIVNGYDSDCCRKLRAGNPLTDPSTPLPTTDPRPENLDRAAITTGLATISMQRCSGVAAATGMVKAQLKVSPAGTVTAVNVQSSPDAALSACVVEQGLRGKFKATQRGGSFSYVWKL